MKHFLYRGSLRIIIMMTCLFWFVGPTDMFANARPFYFEEVTIVLMPEYNLHPDKKVTDPNLLVGFHGKIVNRSKEAFKEIEIPVPSQEKHFALSLAAIKAGENEEAIKPITYALTDDTLTLRLGEDVQPGSTVKFMIEYFSSPITVTKAQKAFEYSYTAIADAALMNIMLFEPYGAEHLKILPNGGKEATDSMGVKMHLYEYTNVKSGQTKTFTVTYEKKDAITTIERVEQIAAEHSGLTEHSLNERASSASPSFRVEWIIGVALMLIIVILFALFFMNRKSQRTINESQPTPNTKKELRKLLFEGKISEKEYLEEVSKLAARGGKR